jgi:vacuolar-type H+-ATPase subunit I/STV1
MKYIKGDPKSPSGSLIAFSEVKGYNPFEPDAKILAVHIVVSPLSAHSYNYPVVVFPVSAFNNKKQFFKIVDFLGNCDVIQLEDFNLPEDEDQDEYIKKRMKMLNEVVQDYVDAYQRKYASSIQEQDLAIFDYLLDFEQLTLPPKSNLNPKIKKKKKKENQLNLENSLKGLEELLNQVENPTASEKSNKNSNIKTAKKIKAKTIQINEFKPYITFIKKYHPEIDIINFEKALEKNDVKLANLYLQKYYAIVDERYETAQYFQNRINELEKKKR